MNPASFHSEEIPQNSHICSASSPDTQYIHLVKEIIEKGTEETGRNGKTKSIFGHSMRFSLKNGELPLLTTKRVAWKTCFKELMWFIRGDTDNQTLKDEDVHIWDLNSTREFLDNQNLGHLEEGDLGKIYGFQWRHWGAKYIDCKTDYTGQGIDQLQKIIDSLKDPEKRSSRRLIMSAWNVSDLDEMCLPPCHSFVQFHVRDNQFLSCALYQRSADVALGVPFNICSYSFLTHILAKHCGLIADEFVHFLGNCHIYEEHIEPVTTQLTREPLNTPKIEIKNTHEKIEDYCLEDIEWIEPYVFHEKIKMDMIA